MPSIAIIGASSKRSKFGNKAVRAYQAADYEVFPVHPAQTEIEGLPVSASIAEVPAEKLDRVSLYVAPSVGIELLDAIAKLDVGELWLNPGTESPELIARAKELGINTVIGCSIVDVGYSPADFS